MIEKSASREFAEHLKLPVTQLVASTQAWLNEYPNAVSPNPLIGQERAVTAIARSQHIRSSVSHIFMALPSGVIVEDVVQRMSSEQGWTTDSMHDWVYLANPEDERAPICISLPPGTAEAALVGLWEYLEKLPGERKERFNQLTETYASAGFRHYLELVADKLFDDIPGSELASVVISHTEPKPWYYCDRVSQASLFGDIRLQSIEGTISAELHLIRPGALLQANGGTLVVNAAELVTQPELWRQLKHILRTGVYEWEQPSTTQAAIHYEPDPIPVDIKVILTGSRELYSTLQDYDGEFANIFPYFAEFNGFYATQTQPVAPYFDFLAYVENKARTRPLAKSAISTLLEISACSTSHQQELSLDAIALIQLLEEAEVLASLAGETEIQGEHISKANIDAENRDRLLAELNWQSIIEQQVQIDTEGTVVGQINGLTIVGMGGVEFGEPSRITATVHYGDGDIIDIERKADLSGSIHTKGIMILTAYLANLFAKQEPMPLSATVVFEQSYHEVDGDSASLAELCCLISALSEVAIDQSIAVTGAIDQFGNVQAIGGINQKIQGYFEICKRRGLSGRHAVIVPKSNLVNIHLSQEIRAAVAQNLFTVYAVSHTTEAFELLMNTPCGEPSNEDKDGLFGRIHQRLQAVISSQHQPNKPWWQRLFKNSDTTES
ncbi:AAA family ATPase [Aliidiomarina iranensis]|nr:AAA family ATPase [Aliidiomarina iranensis]